MYKYEFKNNTKKGKLGNQFAVMLYGRRKMDLIVEVTTLCIKFN